jgi:type 1 glutamine amidotransferase
MRRAAVTMSILLGIMAGVAGAGQRPVRGVPSSVGAKRLLVIADHSTGNQTAHASASHAIAIIERMGRETGAYVTTIRTDTRLVTKGEVWGSGAYAKGGPRASRAQTLDGYDAVLFYTNGETDMSDGQKRDLMAFIKADGKGFVGVHSAAATAYGWPDYADMLGGVFDNHPWKVTSARIVVERPDAPAMRGWTTGMSIIDEHYQMRLHGYSRSSVDVLARLDPRSLDLSAVGVHRADLDFPVAWTKRSGRGRVFYSTLGHTDAGWDDPRIQSMYYQGILWALGATAGDVRPHPQ